MRFFIALDLPEESRLELQEVQQKLKELIPQAKLTDPEKLHLTIAFIGEQPNELKDRLVVAITEAAKDIPPFSVTPSFIDGFPHLHTAKILWAGVKGDTDKLYLLRHKIKDGLEDQNLGVDQRRYVPHIALAKVNNLNLDKQREETLQKIFKEITIAPLTENSVKLFESIPNHGFHSHNTLAQIPLIR